MDIIHWQKQLSTCAYDETVGIKIAKLAGDQHFSTYLTSIDVNKSVKSHYHQHGEEHYHIIAGTGEIILRTKDGQTQTVSRVQQHSSFVVPACTWHQLKNIGQEPLILMFSCPETHLNEDRFLL